MADHDDDAGPVVEELFERAQGVEIEIVRGLVEQQHVGLLEQCEQELEPAALAARECADRRELRVAVEPEPAHQLDVVERGLALAAGHGVAHTLGQVEVAPELVVVADLDSAADLDPTAGRLQSTGDEIQQRALAGTVRADDTDAIARFEHVVERLEDEQRTLRRRLHAHSATRSRRRGARRPSIPGACSRARGRARPRVRARRVRAREAHWRNRCAPWASTCAPARRAAATRARGARGSCGSAPMSRLALRGRCGRRGTPRSRILRFVRSARADTSRHGRSRAPCW